MRRTGTSAMVVLVRDGVEVARWPLTRRDRPDLAVVEELARCQLLARRLGYSIRLRAARVELVELLTLLGLGEVVSGTTGLGGEAEGGEQIDVEEPQ